MGTNYYLHELPGSAKYPRNLHIGKSSGGWAFALHVIPEDDINSLDDWRNLWNGPWTCIKNEYGDKVSPKELEVIITKRVGMPGKELRRSDIDGARCIGHGPGTYDYITGVFS